jgi:hypothetical protein
MDTMATSEFSLSSFVAGVVVGPIVIFLTMWALSWLVSRSSDFIEH